MNLSRVILTVVAFVLGATTPARAADFESAATFQASKILPAETVKGPHHKVAEEVSLDGFHQRFHLVSDFGALNVDGRTLLWTRVTEVDALVRLSEVSKTAEFAKAAGGAVLNVGVGVVSAVKDPVATAKGVGTGVKRFGVNLGRKAKRTTDSVTKDDKKPEGDKKGADDKALDVAGGAANSVLGVNAGARQWAKKLRVDPYSTNPILHKALVDIGRIDAAGSVAAKVIVPIPMVVSTTATVGDLVWSADPEAVRKQNEKRVSELGVPGDVAKRYFVNGNYTLTSQTRLIGALHAVKAKNCADYLDAASEAAAEREALFFVESAELLAGFHKTDPVSAILPDSRAMVAQTGTRAVALLPLDWLSWTERLKKAAVEIGGRAQKELGAKTLEMRLTGSLSPTAKKGLAEAGWTEVKDGVVAGLTMGAREAGR